MSTECYCVASRRDVIKKSSTAPFPSNFHCVLLLGIYLLFIVQQLHLELEVFILHAGSGTLSVDTDKDISNPRAVTDPNLSVDPFIFSIFSRATAIVAFVPATLHPSVNISLPSSILHLPSLVATESSVTDIQLQARTLTPCTPQFSLESTTSLATPMEPPWLSQPTHPAVLRLDLGKTKNHLLVSQQRERALLNELRKLRAAILSSAPGFTAYIEGLRAMALEAESLQKILDAGANSTLDQSDFEVQLEDAEKETMRARQKEHEALASLIQTQASLEAAQKNNDEVRYRMKKIQQEGVNRIHELEYEITLLRKQVLAAEQRERFMLSADTARADAQRAKVVRLKQNYETLEKQNAMMSARELFLLTFLVDSMEKGNVISRYLLTAFLDGVYGPYYSGEDTVVHAMKVRGESRYYELKEKAEKVAREIENKEMVEVAGRSGAVQLQSGSVNGMNDMMTDEMSVGQERAFMHGAHVECQMENEYSATNGCIDDRMALETVLEEEEEEMDCPGEELGEEKVTGSL